MKSTIVRIISLLIILVLFTGCGSSQSLNGVDIREYTIVYSQDAPDYCQRAAQYIQSEILSRTGVIVPVCEASSGTYKHEILVGDTDRSISGHLKARSENMQFAIAAEGGHIALNANYYVIAAAAYYFVQTYIPGDRFKSEIGMEITLHDPITEKPNNYIFMIGDGMGVEHTKMFTEYDIESELPYIPHSDKKDVFYGDYFPYQGFAHTNSLSGTTDSAAGGTALSTGYKTINSYIGKDSELNDLTSLTELAGSLGMATAVLTTDDITGATPSAFSAHANDRNDTIAITASQAVTVEKYGTILLGSLHATEDYQTYISEVLTTLDQSESGFFMMYEEGHIDKFSHNMDLQGAFESVVRFNQVIGMLMEYAFYHPDTFVLITADHETGGLTKINESYTFTVGSHTAVDVPVFAYGQGAEVFDGFWDENTEIPKLIAKMWGVVNFGDNS